MDVDTDADPRSNVPECKFPLEAVSFSLPSTDDVPITQYLDSLVPDEISHMFLIIAPPIMYQLVILMPPEWVAD